MATEMRLNHRIDISYLLPGTPDGAGGISEAWAVRHAGVWANVERLRGARLLEFGKLSFQVLYEVTIRTNWTVGYTDRLIYRGKPLTIHQVDADRADRIVITAWA